MFLDTFKLHTSIFQLQYPTAFEIWDRSGAISRRFIRLWPALKVEHGEPNRVILKSSAVTVRTEIETAILVMDSSGTAEARSLQIREAVDIWKTELDLLEFKRVSMRVQYTKDFPSLKEANAAILDLQMARIPKQKVFDQPLDGIKNGVEIAFRFEDESTFTTLRVKAETLVLERESHPDFPDDVSVKLEKHRMIVDFDRGSLKPMESKNLRAEEWVKGYFHVLRRDIDKVLRGAE
jgi:hypothetical protein